MSNDKKKDTTPAKEPVEVRPTPTPKKRSDSETIVPPKIIKPVKK